MTDERIPASTAITEEGLVIEYNPTHDLCTVNGRVLHLSPSPTGVKLGAFANYPLTAQFTIEGQSYEIGCDWGDNEQVGGIFNTTIHHNPTQVIRLVLPADHPVIPLLYLGERLEEPVPDQAVEPEPTPLEENFEQILGDQP